MRMLWMVSFFLCNDCVIKIQNKKLFYLYKLIILLRYQQKNSYLSKNQDTVTQDQIKLDSEAFFIH
jgi:hypothetical protein